MWHPESAPKYGDQGFTANNNGVKALPSQMNTGEPGMNASSALALHAWCVGFDSLQFFPNHFFLLLLSDLRLDFFYHLLL